MFYHKTDRTGKTSGLKTPSRILKPESVALEIKRCGAVLRQSHCVLGCPTPLYSPRQALNLQSFCLRPQKLGSQTRCWVFKGKHLGDFFWGGYKVYSSSGWPGTHYMDQVGLAKIGLHLPPQVLELMVCPTAPEISDSLTKNPFLTALQKAVRWIKSQE